MYCADSIPLAERDLRHALFIDTSIVMWWELCAALLCRIPTAGRRSGIHSKFKHKYSYPIGLRCYFKLSCVVENVVRTNLKYILLGRSEFVTHTTFLFLTSDISLIFLYFKVQKSTMRVLIIIQTLHLQSYS